MILVPDEVYVGGIPRVKEFIEFFKANFVYIELKRMLRRTMKTCRGD